MVSPRRLAKHGLLVSGEAGRTFESNSTGGNTSGKARLDSREGLNLRSDREAWATDLGKGFATNRVGLGLQLPMRLTINTGFVDGNKLVADHAETRAQPRAGMRTQGADDVEVAAGRELLGNLAGNAGENTAPAASAQPAASTAPYAAAAAAARVPSRKQSPGKHISSTENRGLITEQHKAAHAIPQASPVAQTQKRFASGGIRLYSSALEKGSVGVGVQEQKRHLGQALSPTAPLTMKVGEVDPWTEQKDGVNAPYGKSVAFAVPSSLEHFATAKQDAAVKKLVSEHKAALGKHKSSVMGIHVDQTADHAKIIHALTPTAAALPPPGIAGA